MRKGVYTAVITPFRSEGFGLDEKLFCKLIERQIEAGVHGLVIAGSTGEGQTMNENEWKQAVQLASQYRSQIEVLASCGSYSTWQTIEKAQLALSLGVNHLLISSPPYNKPTTDGLIQHFQSIHESCPEASIMVYNIPGRTAVNISPACLQELWKIPSIQALKESSGNWGQFLLMMRELPQNKLIFSGDDPLNLAFFSHGAHGTVSVLSNLFPKAVVNLWNLCQEGRFEDARKEFFKYQRLIDLLFCESNPIPVKWAVSRLLHQDMKPRLPLRPLSEKFRAELEAEIQIHEKL